MSLLLVVACAGPAPPDAPVPTTAVPTQIAPAQRAPGEPLPAPTGTSVLTLTGKIAQTNGDGALNLDPALLDQFGRVRVKVYEPWVHQDLEFEGLWLADLLAAAQPTGSAQSIHLTALDDYQIDLSMAEVTAGGILLATHTGEGAAIPVEDGGPVRLVFATGVPSGASADQWIWSLTKIDVR